MKIWTSRYGNKSLVQFEGVKIGVTLSKPRFSVGYPFVWLPLLAPARSSFHLEREPFTYVYRAKLDGLGLETVLASLRQASGGRACVLLCFEDLRQPDLWCHRTTLAHWLSKHGVQVEELPEPEGAGVGNAQAVRPVQLSFEV